jgi:predicted nucleic acid-binding protein
LLYRRSQLFVAAETWLYLTAQNLIEFWVVLTRPIGLNGLGRTPGQATDDVRALRRFFPILPAILDVANNWLRIVENYQVSGRQSHDAHLVAVMETYSVSTILTFNTSDFKRYSGILALHPGQVSAEPAPL